MVAEAKGARDSAAGAQCVAPHNCEGEVEAHIRNGVSNVVRGSTGEPGKQVDDWLAEASVCFEAKGDKVVASFLRRPVVFPNFIVAALLHGSSRFVESLLQS